ncbi:conjugal transfer protein TraF [Aquisalimonas sp.]|uniref:conjugal transfer protein TraF n=1 Tax=Aquisalimonas sp. TaxID=1872621 RepID=UPI0025C0D6DB|nr:conjugal transfer protein TraF [Aquisalimonas sp.]
MTKQATIAAGLAAVSLIGAQAVQAGQSAGAQLTYGAAPHELTVTATANPATPSLGDRRIRVGIFSSIGGGLEIGAADDFDRDVEQIADDFSTLESRIQNLDEQATLEEYAAVIDAVVAYEASSNHLVNNLADDAYIKVNASATGPGAPLSIRSEQLDGVITLDYGVYLEGRVGVSSSGDAFNTGLADFDTDRLGEGADFEVIPSDDGYAVLRIDPGGDGSFEEFEFRPSNDAGLAVQGGVVRRLSGGYARQLWSDAAGTLHVGTTLSAYRVTLARSGALLDDSDDTGETAEDAFDENQETSGGFGVHAGAMWVSEIYSLGATLRNINAPSFDYPDPCDNPGSKSCAFFQANPQAKRNGSSWTMERQLTLEGSAYTPDRRWVAHAGLDANSAADTTGDDYQWATIQGSYMPDRFWAPSPRLGYKRNLAGEQLSYLSAGATFFRALHLDAAYALERSSFAGDSIPRAVQASLGLDLQF